jgi:lauroyl/myristoyl acyltransferase
MEDMFWEEACQAALRRAKDEESLAEQERLVKKEITEFVDGWFWLHRRFDIGGIS